MSEKIESEDAKDQESVKLTNEYVQRASYLGTILPLLDIFYDIIIEKRIKKYNLNLVKEFWIYFGLFIFTSLYYFFGVSIEAIVFFLFATLFTLIVYNFDFFKKRILPDEDAEIKKFLQTIEEKKISEVREFVKDHRQRLTDNEIQMILDSTHGNNWIIYDYIFKYQKASQKILMFLIEKNRLEICGEGSFLNYLKKFNFGLSYDNYLMLINRFKNNKKVIKILNLYNPSYNPNKSLFRSSAKMIQSFYISIKQGNIASAISLISFFLVFISIIINYKLIIPATVFLEPVSLISVLLIINLFFSIGITTIFLILIFTIILIAVAKFFWLIISLFSPTDPQIK